MNLYRKLLSARERRLRLATYGHSQHHSIVADSQTNVDSHCDLPLASMRKSSQALMMTTATTTATTTTTSSMTPKTTTTTATKAAAAADKKQQELQRNHSLEPKLSLPNCAEIRLPVKRNPDSSSNGDADIKADNNDNNNINNEAELCASGDKSQLRFAVNGDKNANFCKNPNDITSTIDHCENTQQFQTNGLIPVKGPNYSLKKLTSNDNLIDSIKQVEDELVAPAGGSITTNIISPSPCVTPPSPISGCESRDLSSFDINRFDEEEEEQVADSLNGEINQGQVDGDNNCDCDNVSSTDEKMIAKSSNRPKLNGKLAINCSSPTKSIQVRCNSPAIITTTRIGVKLNGDAGAKINGNCIKVTANHRPPSPRSASTCGGLELYGGNPAFKGSTRQSQGIELGIVQASTSCQDTNKL